MTVTITVRSYAPLPNPPVGFNLGRPFELAVQEGTTLNELVETILAVPRGRIALIAVNGQLGSDNYGLQAQDRVDMFPPIGGG